MTGRLARGLGDEHVAVGQHVQPARMLQALRECRDLQARRRLWVFAPFGQGSFATDQLMVGSQLSCGAGSFGCSP